MLRVWILAHKLKSTQSSISISENQNWVNIGDTRITSTIVQVTEVILQYAINAKIKFDFFEWTWTKKYQMYEMNLN